MKQTFKTFFPALLLLATSASAQRTLPPPGGALSPPAQKAGDDVDPSDALPPPAPRATPGVSSNNKQPNPGPPSAPPRTDAYAPKLSRIGDYVELDEKIKNDMYGTIDFPNAELKDIIKAIAKMANKNFILDRKIENRRITILSPVPVTKQEAYNAFLSSLYANDLTLISAGQFLKVEEAKDALRRNIRVFYGDYAPASEEIVTVLYPLSHLNAEEIQRFIQDLVPRNGRVSSYPDTNTLVMTDTGLNLRRLIAILKNIDVPGYQDQLSSIPVRYASAKTLATLVDEILDAQNGGRRGGAVNRNQKRKTRGGGVITKIIADERTNSLVVLANGRGVEEVRDLVNKLDSPNAAGGGNIHVYYCKNALAEELATTLNGLTNQKKTTTGSVSPAPAVPGFTAPGASSSSSTGVELSGEIKVTADKPTNSLVVVASGSDFAALKKVIEKLDLPRRQVYVETTIMELEVTNNNEFAIGTNVAAPGIARIGGFMPDNLSITDLTNPTALSGLVAGFTTGAKYDISIAGTTYTISSLTGLLKAIEASRQGQILHQPQVMTSDNQEATINVTTKVPTETKQVSTGATTVTTSTINKEEVTISLKITPQIGVDNDLVKLKVEQQIDNFVPVSSPAGQIQTNQRKANTTVVVRNSDTVVIGGLQTEETTDTRSKFPLLGDLPVLGWLFKGSEAEHKRKNLVLFLTPHLINEYSDLINLTGQKIEERRELGKNLFDPDDRGAHNVNKLKKINAADALKAPPTGWGFRSKQSSPGLKQPGEANEEAPPEVKKSETAGYLSAEGRGVAPAPQARSAPLRDITPDAESIDSAEDLPPALLLDEGGSGAR